MAARGRVAVHWVRLTTSLGQSRIRHVGTASEIVIFAGDGALLGWLPYRKCIGLNQTYLTARRPDRPACPGFARLDLAHCYRDLSVAVSQSPTPTLISAVAFCLLFAFSPPAAGQAAPLLETRGVWFATVLGDGNWPESTLDSATKQADDLRDRIREARSLGLNAFVMQVVSRGDAMFASELLPWSARLAGAGIDPGYDPLAVAVDEAHRLGMELHAWINTHRVGDVSTASAFEGQSEPGHVYFEHQGWVANVSGALWLDPSSADARQWMVANIVEIVQNYDVDAVHFDFLRYPDGGLPDDVAKFQFDPRGFADINDWRRDNVSLFAKEASEAVWQEKSWIKIGSAPFGNYEEFSGSWPASWALTSVFQESRRWVQDGWQDYLAPQIYFDIGRSPEPGNSFDSPDFSYLVDDWVQNSANRPVFVGHGAYKSIVFEELDTQIELTRDRGAAGQFFFRFDNISRADFSASYPNLSLQTPMTHRFEAAAPSTPPGVTAVADDQGVRLTWQPSVGTEQDPIGSYVVFRGESIVPDPTDASTLLAVVSRDSSTFTDSSAEPPIERYYYRVAAVSRLGVVSAATDAVGIVPVGLASGLYPRTLRVTTVYPNPTSSVVNIGYETAGPGEVQISIVDILGRERVRFHENATAAGPIAAVVPVDNLGTGLYYAIVADSENRVAVSFVVSR